MKELSKTISSLEPSITVSITARAGELKKEGKDVIGLSAGEPDFDTPSHICDAAIGAVKNGVTRYCAAAGDPDLIAEIIKKFKTDNNLEYDKKQIIVSSGAKQSIYNAIVAICNAGDEVLIPTPYWVTYPELAKAVGAIPVIVKSDSGKVTAKELANAVTPKTKLVIINYPSNPSGYIYNREELEDIARVIVDNDLYVISDEIYEKIIYDGNKHISIASLNKEIYERTVTINGVSKAYAMTGWRIGYLGASKELASVMSRFQSQASHHPSRISMVAAQYGLSGPTDSLDNMVKEFEVRRNLIVDLLNDIPNISCSKPAGAFYVFPDVSAYYGKSFNGEKINNSFELCKYLLDEELLAIVPGSGFGEDSSVRLSFAASEDVIREGVLRLKKGLLNLK